MTDTYAERDVAAALIDPAELARVDAVANAMATKRVELIHQPLSFIWRELAREAISVSGRHLQSEDTNVSEGEESPVDIVIDLCETYGISEVAGDAIRKRIEGIRKVSSARLIPWEPGMRGVDIAFSDGYRVALPVSVSDEHAQHEDAERLSPQGASAVHEVQTPNPNSLQEGALEELIERIKKIILGVGWDERGVHTYPDGTQEEDDYRITWENSRQERDILASMAAKEISASLFTDLAKAKEECGAGAGCCHTAARLEQAEARAEALQQKNKDLEADRNEWRTQHQNLLSVREVDLANLSERIETASRMAAVNIRVASKFAGKNDDLKARAEALQAVIETQEDSIAKLERKVQHWQERAEALRAENEALRAVEAAARDMPRRTPESGGASSVYMFHIVASHVWANDAALKKLDAARALTKGESDA